MAIIQINEVDDVVARVNWGGYTKTIVELLEEKKAPVQPDELKWNIEFFFPPILVILWSSCIFDMFSKKKHVSGTA